MRDHGSVHRTERRCDSQPAPCEDQSIALWDLCGQTLGEPVYNLMGGRTKQRVPVYATTSRPDLAKGLGFPGAKVPLPYGPADGPEGMRKNVSFIGSWREKVGPDFPLMLDCYMALDLQYAAELARVLAPFNLKWIEEPFMPDDYASHAKLAARFEGLGTTTYFATGEHEYTRYGYQQLIEAGVGLLQPDVMWMGGPTEFSRVVAQASAQGVDVVPHGCGVYGYYMAMAFESINLAEFMMMSERGDTIEPNFGSVFTNEPLPCATGEDCRTPSSLSGPSPPPRQCVTGRRGPCAIWTGQSSTCSTSMTCTIPSRQQPPSDPALVDVAGQRTAVINRAVARRPVGSARGSTPLMRR